MVDGAQLARKSLEISPVALDEPPVEIWAIQLNQNDRPASSLCRSLTI
jgi:hypothetical protein